MSECCGCCEFSVGPRVPVSLRGTHCVYAPPTGVMIPRMVKNPNPVLRPGEPSMVMENAQGGLFPVVRKDWWCSYFMQASETEDGAKEVAGKAEEVGEAKEAKAT